MWFVLWCYSHTLPGNKWPILFCIWREKSPGSKGFACKESIISWKKQKQKKNKKNNTHFGENSLHEKHLLLIYLSHTDLSIKKQASPSLTGPKGNGMKLQQGFLHIFHFKPFFVTTQHLTSPQETDNKPLLFLLSQTKSLQNETFFLSLQKPRQTTDPFLRNCSCTVTASCSHIISFLNVTWRQTSSDRESDRYWEILKMIPGIKSVLKSFDTGQRIIHTITCYTPKHPPPPKTHTHAHTHPV